MRHDMDRVIIERPRHGGGVRRPKGERKALQKSLHDPDLATRKQPLERRWSSDFCRKRFSDLLGPIRRYAQSMVGRRWDDVYSEMRQVLSPSSKMQRHAMDHFKDFIIPANEIFVIDDKPYFRRSYGGILWPLYTDDVYVDPDDGIIKRGWKKKAESYDRSQKKRKTVLREGRHFVKIKDVWYEVLMCPITEVLMERVPSHFRYCSFDTRAAIAVASADKLLWNRAHDILFGQDIAAIGMKALKEAYHGQLVYACGKRQINKKMIKKLDLA